MGVIIIQVIGDSDTESIVELPTVVPVKEQFVERFRRDIETQLEIAVPIKRSDSPFR